MNNSIERKKLTFKIVNEFEIVRPSPTTNIKFVVYIYA